MTRTLVTSVILSVDFFAHTKQTLEMQSAARTDLFALDPFHFV